MSNDIIKIMAEKFAINPCSLLSTLKSTAFKQSRGVEVTDEQMLALLIVSNQYNLNPFTKEIYAFPDKSGGIVPVVGVDGWNRIANEHPQFDGVEFTYSDKFVKADEAHSQCHVWVEAILHRKDRKYPIVVREYFDECYRPPYFNKETGYTKVGAWQTHPKRFLRHKAEIQCYRVGFGFVGIYDEDEAQRIIEAQSTIPRTSIKAVEDVDEGFDVQRVDGFLLKLVKRASDSDQWQAASDLISERFKGSALRYAQKMLSLSHEQYLKEQAELIEVTATVKDK